MTARVAPTPRTARCGLGLLLCAALLLVGASGRRWLHADLSDDDRALLGRDVATVDLGLIGVELCRPDGDCVGDWYNKDQYREDRGLRVTSRVTFAAALMAAVLCAIGGVLLIAGRGAHMPRIATASTLGIAGLGAAYVHGAGTSRENPLTAWYGWTFHAGFSFYLTMVTIIAAVALVLLNGRPAAPAPGGPGGPDGQ